MKNHSDVLIFHSQGLCRSAANLVRSHRRIRLREILLARLSALRFDMRESMREFIQINRGWCFTGPDGSKTAVDLPHTWNAIDGQDGGNDYWRGTCLYEKVFSKPEFAADERIYLEFRGVNASAKAELNGELIGTHDGGYSTFRWDITGTLADENHLKVWADNSRNDRVYPQKADFTFYGGIYRDVFLIRVNEKHFDMDHFGGPGIKVTPYTDGMNVVVIILFCIVPMCAWALTLWSMTGYELDGERVKEIQEVNGRRREAIAQGMTIQEAMEKYPSR